MKVEITNPWLVLATIVVWTVSYSLVYADAKRLDGMIAPFWTAIAFFTFPVGPVVYLLVRAVCVERT